MLHCVFVLKTQANKCPSIFVRHKQINAPVYLLDTGKLMPQCILLAVTQADECTSIFGKHKQVNAPVYLLDTGKLIPQYIW